MKRIVISDQDLQEEAAGNIVAGDKKRLSIWTFIILGGLILVPPLLVLAVIMTLAHHRKEEFEFRLKSALVSVWALIISCLLWFVAGIIAFPQNIELIDSAGLEDSITFNDEVTAASNEITTAKDIARFRVPLVVVVSHIDTVWNEEKGSSHEPTGAGVIIAALEEDCLILTSKHVVEGVAKRAKLDIPVGITLRNGQHAAATVVGLHKDLDLALLRVKRDGSDFEYRQDIRPYDSIDVGEVIYTVGHPVGLQFTLSGGLISQKRGSNVLQFSAPVSPGNSGGPVYDTEGKLIALVQAVYDKTHDPNAENLNFAESIDDLHDQDKWSLTKKGRQSIQAWEKSNKKLTPDS